MLPIEYGEIHVDEWPPPPERRDVIFGGCIVDLDETHGCGQCDARFDEGAATAGVGHVRTADEPPRDGRPRRGADHRAACGACLHSHDP